VPHGLPAAVESQGEAHAAVVGAVFMHMRDDRRSGIHPHGADAPRQALAEIEVVAVAQGRCRDEVPAVGDRPPVEPLGQAVAADFARRVLHRLAVGADLHLEAAFRRGAREAERGAAARGGRQRRQAGPSDRILFLRFAERRSHGVPRSSSAAPEHRPRS